MNYMETLTASILAKVFDRMEIKTNLRVKHLQDLYSKYTYWLEATCYSMLRSLSSRLDQRMDGTMPLDQTTDMCCQTRSVP